MTVSISKTKEEIEQLPLVDLVTEILKQTKEPFYFRDLMKEIQELRGMSDEEARDVMARLYTEINIDGRFICLGQNIWGLKRWYPVDKTADKAPGGKKKFVRKSGDAFSEDDEDLDDYDEDDEEDDLEELGSPKKKKKNAIDDEDILDDDEDDDDDTADFDDADDTDLDLDDESSDGEFEADEELEDDNMDVDDDEEEED
jgi:DNA-directed RNA polymerase subunit delta